MIRAPPWECPDCNNLNPDSLLNCSKCNLSKDVAADASSTKRKRMCEECGHMHRANQFCHVYCELDEDDDGVEDEEEVVEEEEEDGGEDEVSLGLEAKKVKRTDEPRRTLKSLQTPPYVAKIRYGRYYMYICYIFV